jgi:hypothetical protein
LAGTARIEIDKTTAKGFGGPGHEMIDTIDVGEGCPDRVLVRHVERDNRRGRAQFLSRGLQRVKRAADEDDAAPTIDDHAGGGKPDAGGSAGNANGLAGESFKIVCDMLRLLSYLAIKSYLAINRWALRLGWDAA